MEHSPLNPVQMSQKQWYRHLVEKNVTMEIVDEEGRMVPKRSKAEERDPGLDWQLAMHVSRMKGLSPEIKSFNFKLVNLILPSKERISQILRNSSPLCTMCAAQVPETLGHALFECAQNNRAAQYLLDLSRVYDSSLNEEMVLKLQVHTDPLYELPTVIVLYSGLHLIWKNRSDRRATKLYDIRAELECIVQTLRKSRSRKLRESGNIIINTLENFHVDPFAM